MANNEGYSDEPANLREAWVNASRFWTVDLGGGGGAARSVAGDKWVMTIDPCTDVNRTDVNKAAESIYIVTRDNKIKRRDGVLRETTSL